MKRTSLIIAPAAALVLGAGVLAGFAPANDAVVPEPAAKSLASYSVDTVHSVILFKIRHYGVANFYGRFNKFDGSFSFDPENHTGGDFEFTVKTDSVDTGNKNRDDHLRSADFFNSRQFGEVTFSSTGIEHVEDDLYKLSGDLTMQGETRPVTANLTWIGTGAGRGGTELGGFEARFEIKRGDFGITQYLAPDGSDNGGLGNTVELIVSIEAVKQ